MEDQWRPYTCPVYKMSTSSCLCYDVFLHSLSRETIWTETSSQGQTFEEFDFSPTEIANRICAECPWPWLAPWRLRAAQAKESEVGISSRKRSLTSLTARHLWTANKIQQTLRKTYCRERSTSVGRNSFVLSKYFGNALEMLQGRSPQARRQDPPAKEASGALFSCNSAAPRCSIHLDSALNQMVFACVVMHDVWKLGKGS